MMFNPTALILADDAQRDLFNSVRLDGPTTEPVASRRDTRTPARRPWRLLTARLRPAV